MNILLIYLKFPKRFHLLLFRQHRVDCDVLWTIEIRVRLPELVLASLLRIHDESPSSIPDPEAESVKPAQVHISRWL